MAQTQNQRKSKGTPSLKVHEFLDFTRVRVFLNCASEAAKEIFDFVTEGEDSNPQRKIMPIINHELVGDSFQAPRRFNLPFGELFYRTVQEKLQQNGDAVWMTDVSTGKSLKYSEMLVHVDLVAANLYQRGLRAGDVVIVMTPNHIETAVFFLAVWKLGSCPVGFITSYLTEAIRSRIEEYGPKFVLTDIERAPRVLKAAESLDSVKEVFVIGDADKCTSYDQLLVEPGTEAPNDIQVNEDSKCWMICSSGTTGKPKAIVYSHRTMNDFLQYPWSELFENSKMLFSWLLVHITGWCHIFYSTMGWGQLYIMSESSDEGLLKSIDQVKPRIVSCFSHQVVYMCRHPNLEQFDMTSVSWIVAGGSSMNSYYEQEIYHKLPNLITLNIDYGMSEAPTISDFLPRPSVKFQRKSSTSDAKHVFGSVGQLLAGNRLKIVDPTTGEKLGPNQVGEICVQSPFMMKEYLNQPEATANTIRDGWLYSGDKGYFDSDEYIYVVGRYKELIIYQGEHVVPVDIEKHLVTHPAVEDVAVIGRPDDLKGQLPTAFVVVKAGHSLTSEELENFVDDRLMDEEKLRGGIRFTGNIPRNDSGKIVRHQLAKMLSLG